MKKIFLGLLIIGMMSATELRCDATTSDYYDKEIKKYKNPSLWEMFRRWRTGYQEENYSKRDVEFLKRGKREGVLKRYLYRKMLGRLTFGILVNKTCWENGKFANFNGADLSNITIDGSLEEELEKADFRYANLSKTTFDGTNLTNANFSYAKCEETLFRNVVAVQAHFMKMRIGTTKFSNTDLTQANFSELRPLIKKEADNKEMGTLVIENSTLNNANFKNVRLSEMSINKTNAFCTIFDNAEFDKLTVTQSDFSESSLVKTEARQTEIKDSNFSSALLTDGKFERAYIKETLFCGAKLIGTNFSNSRLEEFVHFGPRNPKCGSFEQLGYQDPKKAPNASFWVWNNPFQSKERQKFPYRMGKDDSKPAVLAQTNLNEASAIGVTGWKELGDESYEIFLVGTKMGPIATKFIQGQNHIRTSENRKPLGIFTNFIASITPLRDIRKKEGYSVRK